MQKLIGVAVALVLARPLVVATAQTPPVEDQVSQAVQVLPEDLRAGATVVAYDRATGARKVIRQGTNFIECQTRNPDDGFTRCYSKALAPRRDLEAKLKAEKQSDTEIQDAVAAAIKAGTIKPPAQGVMSYRGSDEEVQEAIAEATRAGTIKPTPFGTMSYRLYGKKDRIQLLWVLSVPKATPESIGVSEGSQRDEALKGQGVPWLMLPGTPGAHIIIPINK